MRIDVDGLKGSAKESFASALSSLSQQNAFFETFVLFYRDWCCLEEQLRDIPRADRFSPENHP